MDIRRCGEWYSVRDASPGFIELMRQCVKTKTNMLKRENGGNLRVYYAMPGFSLNCLS